MGEKMPGTVEAVSKNKAPLVVSNDEGWTVVELIGREGEIAVGDSVDGDWHASSAARAGSEELQRDVQWKESKPALLRREIRIICAAVRAPCTWTSGRTRLAQWRRGAIWRRCSISLYLSNKSG
jgi:hypothetical protein